MSARLVRECPVRMVDYSLSGCLVTVDHPLEEGTVGELQVTLNGKRYQDTVEIVRTTRLPGSTPACTMAAEFAWRNRPGTVSVRGTVPSVVPGASNQ